MDETESGSVDLSGIGAWLGARTGNAIDALIDREVRKPPSIIDPSQAYGIDEFGNLYQRGQLAATASAPRTLPSNTIMVGIAVILLVVLLKA